ncbi:unnamed protein product, partial [Urochloa humidicola]
HKRFSRNSGSKSSLIHSPWLNTLISGKICPKNICRLPPIPQAACTTGLKDLPGFHEASNKFIKNMYPSVLG